MFKMLIQKYILEAETNLLKLDPRTNNENGYDERKTVNPLVYNCAKK